LPRPRVVRNPRFIGFEVEAEIYEALRKIAFERRTSISNVARELLVQAARQLGIGEDPPSQTGAGDPPGIDPVIKMDIEDFEEELAKIESALSSIERELERNPHLARQVANPLLQSMRQSLLSSISNIEEKLRKLRSRYYSLKRVARDNGETEKLAARLYDLRRRIKSVRKQLGVKA
jgi:chaperonin cofactor prefoldin